MALNMLIDGHGIVWSGVVHMHVSNDYQELLHQADWSRSLLAARRAPSLRSYDNTLPCGKLGKHCIRYAVTSLCTHGAFACRGHAATYSFEG
jgi:hypothetical protein